MAIEQADSTVRLARDGGLAVVVLSKEFDVPSDYALHPQVHQLLASELPTEVDNLSSRIPHTTRIVMIAGTIPALTFSQLKNVVARRNIPFVQRRNQEALAGALRDVLHPVKNGNGAAAPPPPSDTDKGPRAGSLLEFIKSVADLGKGSAEEGRRVFALAQARGIQCTVGSVIQGVGVLKRKGGRTETPKSLRSSQDKALSTLDEAIAGLQLVREYVAETDTLNAKLKKKLAAMMAVISQE